MYDWSDIRIFLAVAREGSTLAASRQLNINNTTVSRRIQALEHGLQLTLFMRDTRGYSLTPQGKALLARAETLEQASLDIAAEAERLNRDLSGAIRVTAPEALMTHIISPIMMAYRTLHPEVRFENLSAETQVSLERGDADIAFRATDAVVGDTLIARRLPDITWSAYCSKDYIASHGMPEKMEDLRSHAIVSFGKEIAHLGFVKWFVSHTSEDKIAATCNSVPNMAGMIRAGVGVGLLWTGSGDPLPDLVRCFPPPPELDTPWWLVASQEAHSLLRVRSFMDFAADKIDEERYGLRKKGEERGGLQ